MLQASSTAITGRQRPVLALVSAMPDRSDGMNDLPRRKTIAFGDFGIAGGAAMKRAAFGEQLRPCRAMDRTIDTTAAQQRGIRGVDDGVNA